MTIQEMADKIAEVLAVDTEENFASDVICEDSTVKFESEEGEIFILTVSK